MDRGQLLPPGQHEPEIGPARSTPAPSRAGPGGRSSFARRRRSGKRSPSRHENPQPRAAAARLVQAQRRCRASARCPQCGGGSAEPPLSTAGAPSARIDPRIAAAARSPGVLPVVPGSGGSPRLAEPGRSPPTGCRRRRFLGWLTVAWAVPAGPAPPAPWRAAPRAAGWSVRRRHPGGRPPGLPAGPAPPEPRRAAPPDDAFVLVGD
jgi:hypothetical protein